MNKVIGIVLVISFIAVLSGYIVLSKTGSPPTNRDLTSPQLTVTTPSGTNSLSTPQANFVTVRYKTTGFVDTQGIGTKAFSMLIPENWQSSGDIYWILDNPAMPAFGSFKTWNQNGPEEYNYFANQAFFWSTNQFLLQTFPIGTHYFGAEVREPLGPTEALKQKSCQSTEVASKT
jgi:hypothetical protein